MNELHGPADNPIVLDFNSLGNRDKSLLVGALFRQSLIQTGKSPDYHLDKLDDDFLAHAGGAVAGRPDQAGAGLHGEHRRLLQ